MEKATFVQRVIAYLIDVILVSIVTNIISAIIGFVLGDALGAGILALVYPISLAINFVYFGYFWSGKGKTIGMGIMNIQVVAEDGSNPSFVMGGLRGTVGYLISGIVFGLGFLWMLFDDEKRTWHDMVFKTSVVKA